MTKKDLINSLSIKSGVSKKDTDALLKALPEAILEHLAEDGGNVQIPGLGTFKAPMRAAREGKNPLTGEKMSIPARKVLKFTPSSVARKALGNSENA